MERTVYMRKRNIHVQCWLDKKEAEQLQKLVKRSGLTRETYLRHLISGVVPQDAPPPDYHAMMRELRGIGTNLNQLAHRANALGEIDTARFDVAAAQINWAIVNITNAVLLPRKRE
jgi:peptide subunit release factor 1 (eRF1)